MQINFRSTKTSRRMSLILLRQFQPASKGGLGNVFDNPTEDWDSTTRQSERFRINFKGFTCEAHDKDY
jgi:hypothetical protein